MDNKQKRDLQEVKNIREKYITEKNPVDKIATLKKLDASTKRPGRFASVTVGVIGALFFGLGMSFIMVWPENRFAVGILFGILGLVGIAAAYPVYLKVTKNQREKIASKVVELADEIIEQNNGQ